MSWAPVVSFVAVDCETTGLDPHTDEIIQLAAVRVQDGQIVDRFNTLVASAQPPSLMVQRLTGITAQRLEGAPILADVVSQWRRFAADWPLVGHNVGFDLQFLRAALDGSSAPRLVAPVYDTLELGRLLCPAATSHRLEAVAALLEVPLVSAHDALADAEASAWVFLALQHALTHLSAPLRATLLDLLDGSSTTLRALIPPPDRPALPTVVRQRSESRNRPDAAEPAPVTLETLQAQLAPGSAMADALEPFEPRDGQMRLLTAVWNAFTSGRHLVAEAGTGTGKSLAYLLPAVAWAAAQNERVVVATHTLNLQEQLIGKDLPLVACALPTGGVALLKGRGQYLCRKLWEDQLRGPIRPEDRSFLARVAVWLEQTESGDRSELMLYGEDEDRFGALSCEAVACTGRHCPFYEACYLFSARRKAEQAHVVVVNHALLLSDVARGGGVLPEHAVVVCDEAHHLEAEAAAHLGCLVGERALQQYFRHLERMPEDGGRGRGVLPSIRSLLEAQRLLEPLGTGLATVREATSLLARCQNAAEICFAELRSWVRGQRPPAIAGRYTLRFAGDGMADTHFSAFVQEGGDLADGLSALARSLGKAADALEDGVGSGEPSAELRSLGEQAGEFAAALQQCLQPDEQWVRWCEIRLNRDGGAGAAVLHAAPVDPGPLLERLLFAPSRSVVLTSATLTVGGRFDFIRQRLGIHQGPQAERTDTLSIGSPFDFAQQALLCLPTDLMEATASPSHLASAVAPFLVQLFTATGGGGLVLCTSYAVLSALREQLRGPLETKGILCLAQGVDGSRAALTAALRRDEATVVLGAASFWEGVDIPGPALRCLVIVQLPFSPPDIPLLAAHLERIAEAGGNGFASLQLPEAVLRFKQGFGRLIRRGSDRGVVVVLDPRIGTRRYGEVFLRSLPGPALMRGHQQHILQAVTQWLDVRK